jgi:uncharacterized protein YecE (DUF72 family)
MRPPIVLYDAPGRARTEYRIGLCSWMDRSMLDEGHFYPQKTLSAEDRLWWYSRFFDTVEINSTFYALPSEQTVAAWAHRTPPGFLFNVKAYGLLTGHDVDVNRLPPPLRQALPRGARGRRPGQVASSAFDADARAWALGELRTALRPLEQADKLGYILFQLAPWMTFSTETLDYLASLPAMLPGSVIAVEFRHRSWFGAHTQETLGFLAGHGLTYVSIDGPRGRATVPSLPALTTPVAVFRLHGRNFQGFLKQVQGKAPTVAEKYDYLYPREELEEIARAAGALNGRAQRVHLQLNNNRSDFPAINAIQLKEMLLEAWHPPDREALVRELAARRAQARQRGRAPAA